MRDIDAIHPACRATQRAATVESIAPLRRSPALHLLVNLVLVFAIAIAGLATWRVAHAQTSNAGQGASLPVIEAGLVRPNDMNMGGLLLPSKREGYYVEAPRLSTDVSMEVNGPLARVRVTQRFENPSDGWVEGIYVFPLPEESAVDTLKMRVGERLIEGVIKVREEAREIYEQAKREGRKAALLEQQRDNLFTNNVANIGPGETVIVQIEYQQAVRQDNGSFSLRFPMVVAPRYSPQPVIQTVDFSNGNSGYGTIDPVPDRQVIDAPILDPRENAKINPVTLSVRLAAGFPIGTLETPFHEMVAEEIDTATRLLTLKNDSVPADRDFELIWRSSGSTPSAALFTEEVAGERYVLAFLTPPELPLADLPRKDREIIFVLDNSGSMAGESIDQAKQALEAALRRLTPADRFNIVRFDDTHEIIFEDAVPADRENIAVARRFVSRLTADGGTEMLPALRTALIDRNRDDTSRVRQVVFITDGAIGNEQQLFDEIALNRGRSRVFTIGIGSAPNSFFMNRAAELGRGTFTHIGSASQVAGRMQAFFEKLENPVLTGLSVQGRGVDLSEANPDPLPDLYRGEPVVLAAKISGLEGSLRIEGDYAGTPWIVDMPLSGAASGEGVGKHWARRKIASLEASRSYATDHEQINRAVEQVALAHHLVSNRTSLVAVDVKVTRPAGEEAASVKLPLNLPAGWDADKWFDDPASPSPAPREAALQRFSMLGTAQLLAAAPDREAAAMIAQANRQAVQLPQTATQADRMIQLGLLLLLFGAMVAVLAQMYRRAAHDLTGGRRKPSSGAGETRWGDA